MAVVHDLVLADGTEYVLNINERIDVTISIRENELTIDAGGLDSLTVELEEEEEEKGA